MKRNIAALVGIALCYAVLLLAAENSPESPAAGYVLAALYVALGALAYVCFIGEAWKRMLLIACTAILGALIVALLVSDRAYPYVGVLFAAPVVALAAAGGLGAAAGRGLFLRVRRASNSNVPQ